MESENLSNDANDGDDTKAPAISRSGSSLNDATRSSKITVPLPRGNHEEEEQQEPRQQEQQKERVVTDDNQRHSEEHQGPTILRPPITSQRHSEDHQPPSQRPPISSTQEPNDAPAPDEDKKNYEDSILDDNLRGRRLAMNRVSAKLRRDRKRNYLVELEEKVNELMASNERLISENNQLKEDIRRTHFSMKMNHAERSNVGNFVGAAPGGPYAGPFRGIGAASIINRSSGAVAPGTTTQQPEGTTPVNSTTAPLTTRRGTVLGGTRMADSKMLAEQQLTGAETGGMLARANRQRERDDGSPSILMAQGGTSIMMHQTRPATKGEIGPLHQHQPGAPAAMMMQQQRYPLLPPAQMQQQYYHRQQQQQQDTSADITSLVTGRGGPPPHHSYDQMIRPQQNSMIPSLPERERLELERLNMSSISTRLYHPQQLYPPSSSTTSGAIAGNTPRMLMRGTAGGGLVLDGSSRGRMVATISNPSYLQQHRLQMGGDQHLLRGGGSAAPRSVGMLIDPPSRLPEKKKYDDARALPPLESRRSSKTAATATAAAPTTTAPTAPTTAPTTSTLASKLLANQEE